jgi:hypothetical protein
MPFTMSVHQAKEKDTQLATAQYLKGPVENLHHNFLIRMAKYGH